MSTAAVIFFAVCLKALLTKYLRRKGWWPDWEERALKIQEHKRVIDAYERWCAAIGRRPAADQDALTELSRRRGY